MEIRVELVVDDPRLIVGVEFARDQYNASLPEGALALTSEQYIRFVAQSAVQSYAMQAERYQKMKEAGLVD